MFSFIISLISFLTLFYVCKILFFYSGLFRLKTKPDKDIHTVTVLIPARNEEENIEFCLDSLINQNFPKAKLEIIVIDDDSEDATAEKVRDYFDRFSFIQMIQLDKCPPGVSPKKRALKAGIDAAANDIIFTIDADCTARPDWIRKMVSHFSEKVGMVTGYVAFNPGDEKTAFQKIQSLEFIGLTTAGIGSIGAGDPVIANGANLAFRKKTFFDAHGYANESHIVSGDDDLLLQNIDKETDWLITASIDPDTVVFTHPAKNFGSFMNQRIRWASKGLVYRKLSLVGFLISVYLFYLLLFISVPFALMFPLQFPYPLIALAAKFVVDYLIIAKGTALLNRKNLRRYFLPAEIFQIPYILYVGFAGVLGAFEWKGR